MRRFTCVTLVLVALVASTVLARQSPPPTRWEYLQLVPGLPSTGEALQPAGYRACQAAGSGWTCRSFETQKDADAQDALPRARASLGADGWELVTAIDQTIHLSYPKGLTYMFKRQQPR